MAGGALGGGNKGPRMITDINVTPLVDVMLVLLIIFMVTATYIVRQSLDVKLPEASTAEASTVTLLAITVDTAGQMKLNGEVVDEAAIRRFISEQRTDDAKLEGVIAADKNVPHGKVVRILDLLRSEGVVKIGINVLKRRSDQPKK
jgi:biopolymer transport protein ExbD